MFVVKNTEQYSASHSRVAITGMGIVSSTGTGITHFEQILQNGQSFFSLNEHFKGLSFPVIAALLKNFNFEKELNNFSDLPEAVIALALKAGRRAPLVIQSSLIAALEAWQSAKLYERSIAGVRIGLIVAGHNTTQRYQYDLQNKFREELVYLPSTYALHFMDTDHVGTISHVLGIQGEGFTVGGASASGNMGIIQAYRLIKHGYADVCVVVGALADLSPWEIQGFYNIGALGGQHFQHEPLKACRPFDSAHEGFIWGQASGCLILESGELAKSSNIRVLGEIKAVAMNLDGNRLPDPSLLGETRVMQQVLHNAGLIPNEIDYVNTHGSSSPLGDKTEVASLHVVFGETLPRIWLNSTKSLIGHCLWSAGIIEAIATLLQLEKGYVHPNLNLDNPIDDVCRFVGSRRENALIEVAMSNSFGFGGLNTSLIITRGEI